MHAQAIQIESTGGPEVMKLVDRPITEPGATQVRIRHHACGVNFIDIYHRTGLYPVPMPAVLGEEGAGVVEAVGAGVTHLAVGDRVAYAGAGLGSYATHRTLDARTVVRLPDSIDFERGAAMMLKGLTVQYLLRRTRPQLRDLAPGDWIVWHAAAGGVGLIACQWAAALGLRVIATAGSPTKCELALAAGATHAIDYTKEDVVARVREWTGGRGVRVVYDSVGKDTWERSLDCLEPLGLMVSFGNASGAVPPISLRQLAVKGSLTVTRPTLTTHMADRTVAQQMADELFSVVLRGSVRIDQPKRYALAEAASAHRDLEARATTGASILVPS
jgi:NADPH2:quinone reductase